MSKKIRSMAIFILLFSLAIFSCGPGDDAAPGTYNKTYAVGDTGPSGVGIVFYVTDDGLHGLEAAPPLWNGGSEDPKSAWSNVYTPLAGTDTAMGTGLANSDAIIAQTGHTASAAKLCRDYKGGSKNDWFLPSKDELVQLQAQRTIVGGFTVDFYWSSSESSAAMSLTSPLVTEDTSMYAWLISFFPDGIAYPKIHKAETYYVRPVRAF